MLPELVVVWFALTAIAPPITFKFPATEFVPVIVTPAVLPVFPKVKEVLLTKDQVGSNVWAELKLVEEGSTFTAPEVLTTKPAV
jgi:hypothetical protein